MKPNSSREKILNIANFPLMTHSISNNIKCLLSTCYMPGIVQSSLSAFSH